MVASLRLLVLEISPNYGSLCPRLSTCARAALLQLGFMSSEGLTQYCQGWLAPNWNDTFFPLQACNYYYVWGWIQCQSKCFPYVSFFKKEEKNHKWEPADKAEPATQASASSTSTESGLPWVLDSGASAWEVTRRPPCPPEIYVNATLKGRPWDEPLFALLPQYLTGVWLQPNNATICCLFIGYYRHLPSPPAIRSYLPAEWHYSFKKNFLLQYKIH